MDKFLTAPYIIVFAIVYTVFFVGLLYESTKSNLAVNKQLKLYVDDFFGSLIVSFIVALMGVFVYYFLNNILGIDVLKILIIIFIIILIIGVSSLTMGLLVIGCFKLNFLFGEKKSDSD